MLIARCGARAPFARGGFHGAAAARGGKPGRQLGHHRAPQIRAHRDPIGDLVARASATEAEAGFQIDRTDEDAG